MHEKETPLNHGTSLDMLTIDEPSGATTFVTPSDVHQYNNISEQFDNSKVNNLGGMVTAPVEKDKSDNIKELLEDPDDELKELIEEFKQTGKVDNKEVGELHQIASILNDYIEKSTNLKINVLGYKKADIKKSIALVKEYNKYIKKYNKDDRIYNLSKILLKK